MKSNALGTYPSKKQAVDKAATTSAARAKV
jgi:hypothetical protein